MSFYTRLLNQRVTYWAPPTKDEWGDGTFAAPVTFACHWEDKTETFFNQAGVEQHSRSIVLTEREVAAGGFLYLGKSTAANPRNQVGADLIQVVSKIPTVRATETTYRAFL